MEPALAIQSELIPVSGVPLLESYPAAFRVTPRADHYDSQGHLNNAATVRIFQDVRLRYMHDNVQAGRLGLIGPGLTVGVREMVVSYVTEAFPGEQLFGGCRILGRSRRSWCFDELLATEDRVVARMRLVECAIQGGKAVEVPAPLWAAMEVAEGREMPVRELPVGRTPWDVD